jgi:hypothetical protein
MPDETMTPEELEAAVNLSIAMVVNQGREDFGNATFDSICQDFSTAVGAENVKACMETIIQCDAPPRVLEYLSNYPDRAKKLAHMPQARRAAEIGRIESQIMPNGLGDAGAEPAWLARERSGEKRGLGDDLDPEVWNRNFKKKYPGGWIPPSLRR